MVFVLVFCLLVAGLPYGSGQLCIAQDIVRILEEVFGSFISLLVNYTKVTFLGTVIYDDVIDDGIFDFIIIGGGTAGSVIANRLSEISDWKILLIEAGQEPCFLMEIAAMPAIWQFTQYNWGYLAEKQANFGQGLDEGLMALPRGKGLGGSSLINFMINTRGNKVTYDRWADLGNPGWSYDNVLPYFKKLEDNIVKFQDADYHGKGGPLSVQDVGYRTKISEIFIQAGKELGYDYVDYNGRSQIGFSYVQASTRNGLRCSTEKAYLRPTVDRRNLKILTNSLVTKILVDSNKKAYGVEYFNGGIHHKAYASKEVILSAGAFHSPQLLMLSGIGPKDHLEEMNIPVIKDLPVGRKMYDHLSFMGLVFTINQPYSFQLSTWTNPLNIPLLFLFGTGPLTTLSAVEALAYLNTNRTEDNDPTYPDIEYIFIGGGMQTDLGLIFRKVFRVSDEVYDAIWRPLTDKHTWSILPMLLHPKSYGTIKLRSSNPFDPPKIFGNYLTDPNDDDINVLLGSIRQIQKLANTKAFQDVGSTIVSTPIPSCENYVFDSDDYWKCAIRSLSTTLHHQVSTCKMGPSDDVEAVVSNELRVYGISNLRVADLSVIPVPMTSHTYVPAVMIGEKASDMIKESWGYKK